jgi:hypothetical protein
VEGGDNLVEKVVITNRDVVGENSVSDIRAYFMRSGTPLKENEFKDFWMSLTEAEKDEFRHADLSK